MTIKYQFRLSKSEFMLTVRSLVIDDLRDEMLNLISHFVLIPLIQGWIRSDIRKQIINRIMMIPRIQSPHIVTPMSRIESYPSFHRAVRDSPVNVNLNIRWIFMTPRMTVR